MASPNNLVGKAAVLYEKNLAAKALLSFAPGGAALHELLLERGNQIVGERTEAFFDGLGAGTIALTEELIQSNDFLHCYFKTLKAAQQTRKKEKIELLASMLRGAIQSSEIDFDQYEELLDVLDEMSLREIMALQMLRRHEVASRTSIWETEHAQITSYWKSFRSDAITSLGLEEKEFDPFIARLVRTGFYKENTESFYDDTPKVGVTTRQFERLVGLIEQHQ
ncbi:hypothetical protein [Polaromonas sp. UC242_47]|uniref:hypothetical protein n=1 Tax=Polaromonas sp. UC242_47 TaxID=3374626 RepID=UPI0037A95203